MAIFDIFKRKNKTKTQLTNIKQERIHMGIPFIDNGINSNPSKPLVNLNYKTRVQWAPFGADNLYPNKLENYYFLDPTHSFCIDFTVNAIFRDYKVISKTSDAIKKLEYKTFEKLNKLRNAIEQSVRNIKIHEQVFIEVDLRNDIPMFKVLDGGMCRLNYEKTKVYISDSWYQNQNIIELPTYQYGSNEKRYVIVYQTHQLGMNMYPLPKYNSILVDIEQSQDIAHYRSVSIKNGVFPGVVLSLPYEITTDEEKEQLQDMIYSQKGTQNVNKWFVISGDGKENVPKVDTLDVARGIDGLFKTNESSINERILKAHKIPKHFIESTAGQLGGNQQMIDSFLIFEENTARHYREVIEDLFNDMFDVIFPGFKIDLIGMNLKKLLAEDTDDVIDIEKNDKNEQ